MNNVLLYSTLTTRCLAAVLYVATLLPGLALAGEPGTAGFLSLRLGTGARAAGMGDTQVSIASDATAAYWNPAGLASVQTTSFALQHNEWFDSVRIESASLGHATDLGVFGLHFSGLYMDEIQRFETASGSSQGAFNVFEIAAGLAYARTVADDWDVGMALKGLFTELDDETASGWAIDLGVRYRTRVRGLTFAGVGQHLGPNLSFVTDDFELPATARVGGDYQIDLSRYDSHVIVAYDLEIANDDDDPRNHFGLEYTYREILSLRTGMKTGFDSQGGTFGVGVRKASYRFDYAFSAIDNDLGAAHRFSVGIDL